jgi:hypothetical protein
MPEWTGGSGENQARRIRGILYQRTGEAEERRRGGGRRLCPTARVAIV